MKAFSLLELMTGIRENLRMREEIALIIATLKELLPVTDSMQTTSELRIKGSHGTWTLLTVTDGAKLGLQGITFQKYNTYYQSLTSNNVSLIPVTHIAGVHYDLKALVDGLLKLYPLPSAEVEQFIQFAAVHKASQKSQY